jgi:hypothetical protein
LASSEADKLLLSWSSILPSFAFYYAASELEPSTELSSIPGIKGNNIILI